MKLNIHINTQEQELGTFIINWFTQNNKYQQGINKEYMIDKTRVIWFLETTHLKQFEMIGLWAIHQYVLFLNHLQC